MKTWHKKPKMGESEEASPAGRSLWTRTLLLTLLALLFVPDILPPIVAVGILALLTLAVLRMQAMIRRLVRSRQTLKRYIHILQSVFDNMAEGVLVADEKGQLLGYNPAAEQLLQLMQGEGFHADWTALHGVYLPNRTTPCPVEEFPLLRAVRGETVDMVEIFVQHRQAPEGIWLGCTARPLREKNGEQWGGLMVVQNITERKRGEQLLREKMRQVSQTSALLMEANARLEEQAMTDGLTSLRNRRAFCKSLDQEMQRSMRYLTPLSLLIMDVDKFKAYNDTFGHVAGDEVLRQVADVLQESARTTDVAARYGGEEFALILPNTDAQGAVALAERIRESVAKFAWTLRKVTISIGVATLDPEITEEEEFIAAADRALYAAKARGRDYVVHAQEVTVVGGQAIVQQKINRVVA